MAELNKQEETPTVGEEKFTGNEPQAEEPQVDEPEVQEDKPEQGDKQALSDDEYHREEVRKMRSAGQPDPEMAREAYKVREVRRKLNGVDEPEQASQPKSEVGDDEVRNVAREELNKLIAEQQKQLVESEIRSLARSDAEAEHMLEIYSRRIVPSGNPREDALNAQLLANRKYLESIGGERQRYTNSQSNQNSNVVSQQRTATGSEAPELSEEDKKFLKDMPWNSKTRRFEGKHYSVRYVNGTWVQERT